MSASVSAICFDLFYTLVDMRQTPEGSSTSDLLGIDREVWNRKIVEAAPHHALGAERDPIESVRLIAHAIDPTIPLERIRSAAAARPQRFRTALLDPPPGALAALERIRPLGLKLGLISNAGLDEVTAWEESPLARFFDAALFSCHERLMKPDPRIYRLAADRLGVEPEATLYVGDGGSQEHQGANAVGMQTVLFLGLLSGPYPEMAAERPRIARWVIEDYPALVALVERLARDGLPAR